VQYKRCANQLLCTDACFCKIAKDYGQSMMNKSQIRSHAHPNSLTRIRTHTYQIYIHAHSHTHTRTYPHTTPTPTPTNVQAHTSQNPPSSSQGRPETSASACSCCAALVPGEQEPHAPPRAWTCGYDHWRELRLRGGRRLRRRQLS
jgi:hypothetical protein